MNGKHYIDNPKFFEAMCAWKILVNEAKDREEEKPPVTDYIAECFMLISEHLSYKPNFINYTYRDDLLSDGIENCLNYAHNFNPEKSKNPFAYFTQIIYFSFIRRINKENKNIHLKYKLISDNGILERIGSYDNPEDMQHIESYVSYLKKNTNYEEFLLKDAEKKEAARKEKEHNNSLDKFMD